MEKIDIYRTACLMLEQYEDEAILQAALRADEFLEKGDVKGATVWRQIAQAIGQLCDKDPAGSLH